MSMYEYMVYVIEGEGGREMGGEGRDGLCAVAASTAETSSVAPAVCPFPLITARSSRWYST